MPDRAPRRELVYGHLGLEAWGARVERHLVAVAAPLLQHDRALIRSGARNLIEEPPGMNGCCRHGGRRLWIERERVRYAIGACGGDRGALRDGGTRNIAQAETIVDHHRRGCSWLAGYECDLASAVVDRGALTRRRT